jgi:hypothetical protein
MARSPAGRRAPRTGGASPDEWLEVPGWRRPLDTLLVLAVTFATAWVGLVVIPAAANSDSSTVTDRPHSENDASPPTADPTQDPRQWLAGPAYTGGPAAPATEQAVATGNALVVAAPRAPALRATPPRTTTPSAPRTTTKPPAPTTTVGAAVAAAVSTPGGTPSAVTTTPVTTTPVTTTPEVTTTPTGTTTSSETTSSSPTTTETTTSSPPATSEPAP